MNIYQVTYNGCYAGGVAFVQAEDESDAITRVMLDSRTENFNNIEVTKIDFQGKHGAVFYNDSGDY